MSETRIFVQNGATYLLPFFVFLLPQIITGQSNRQLLQYDEFYDQVCVFDDGCKPNPEVIQSLIDSEIQENQAQCIAYGVDNVTCQTNSECTYVADTGKFLDKKFSDYGLCVRRSTTDRAVALNELRAVYQWMLDYQDCLSLDSSYYLTAQCALQEDGCTRPCIDVPDQFPPHCRVNTSYLDEFDGLEEFTITDPLDGLEEVLQMEKPFVIFDPNSILMTRCFITAREVNMLENLLLCLYGQLYAAMNTSKEGVYENCQVRKLYRFPEYLFYYQDTWNYYESQECFLKTESECNTTTTPPIPNGITANVLKTAFFPVFLGSLSLMVLAFY